MKRFRMTAAAKLDLLEIWHYIAKNNFGCGNN
jgi:plasmid stabilization system protein ParE